MILFNSTGSSAAAIAIPMERTFTAVGGETNISIVGDNLTSYVRDVDPLFVYENGLPIFKGEGYNVNANNTSIDLIGHSLTVGQQIHFVVLRYINLANIDTATVVFQEHINNTLAHEGSLLAVDELPTAPLLRDADLLGGHPTSHFATSERVQVLEEMPIYYPNESYMAFCTNASANSLDAAFGKGNENLVVGIGRQLAMYAWFKGDSKITYPFTNLVGCVSLSDCFLNGVDDLVGNANVLALLKLSPYAISKIPVLPELVLYDAGDEKTSLTGGYESYSSSDSLSMAKNSTDMQVFSATPSAWTDGMFGGAMTKNPIQTSLYNKVKVTFNAQGSYPIVNGVPYYRYLAYGKLSDMKSYTTNVVSSGLATVVADIGYFYGKDRLLVGRKFGRAEVAGGYEPINIKKISLIQG